MDTITCPNLGAALDNVTEPAIGSVPTYQGGDVWLAQVLAGASLPMVAATALSGHRVVAANGAGLAIYASSANSTVLAAAGLTTGAVASGASVQVLAGGEMVEPSWNWTPGPVWLGLNGLLTQTPPSTGALLQVGTALGATRLLIEIDTPVFL